MAFPQDNHLPTSSQPGLGIGDDFQNHREHPEKQHFRQDGIRERLRNWQVSRSDNLAVGSNTGTPFLPFFGNGVGLKNEVDAEDQTLEDQHVADISSDYDEFSGVVTDYRASVNPGDLIEIM